LIPEVSAQDSLSLEKYYPKPKITSVEFLIGANLFSLRGYVQEPARSTGRGTYFFSSLKEKASFSFGIGLTHRLGKHFELNGRLLWDRKSYVDRLDSITFTSNFQIESILFVRSEQPKNDYLTVSILPQYIFGNKVHFNVGAGGYIGSLISSSTEVVQASQPTYSYVSTEGFNKYDFGLSLNVGFSYPIKTNLELTIQLFTNYGLSQISDWLISFNYPPWYYNSYSAMIGIRYFNKQRKFKINL
jgi:hypothetical protein